MAKGALIGQGRMAEVFLWENHQVLKLFRSGTPIASIEKEAQISQIVHKVGLPTPAAEGIVEVEGRSGIVYEYVKGPSMLAEMSQKPWKLIPSAQTLAKLHAAMHACSLSGLPSQREQLERKIRSAGGLSAEKKEVIIKALNQLPDGSMLCHGDFHPDNLVMSSSVPMIIDWAAATRGNPLADVAWTSMLLRLGDLPPSAPILTRWFVSMGRRLFHASYLKRYLQLCPDTDQQLTAWHLPILAARLDDEIAEEQNQLLILIEAALSR